ncbi:MAG TPA: heme ABC exporter ATP-binding protein CcmA [Acidimicrobiales bacterium]|jgi:heme ABC exporter ATP-binding subunit CcmA|nr:heme ABC exporter ATP-binding protein CcmA [Acidimicrobiales bacterium]
MPLAVRLRSAVSLLGRFPALAGVDLDVAAGEVVLVRGPNGAGKSTLLRGCAGLVAFTSGEAEVLGHDLRKDRKAVRRRIGLLGHATFLYDDLTVADNLRFSARAAGASPASATEAMARLGLDGRLRDVTVVKLSAGQRRRVAVAAVVARRPDLWLLDEPHAGLDAAGRDLLDTLVGEAALRGATVLLASHELDRASAIATRTVVMAGGQVTGGALSPPADPAVGQPERREPAVAVPAETAVPENAGPQTAVPQTARAGHVA